MNKRKINFLLIPFFSLLLLIGCTNKEATETTNTTGTDTQVNVTTDNTTVEGDEMMEEDAMMEGDEMMEDNTMMEGEGMMEDNTMMNGDEMMEEDAMMEADSNVKEFEMDSFTEIIDGKYHPQFSVKNLEVKKGDTVKIKVNVTSGNHNFKIDEFDVFSETPTGEVTTIEFVADKLGEFVYYCAKPGHRENGHWGTLVVTE